MTYFSKFYFYRVFKFSFENEQMYCKSIYQQLSVAIRNPDRIDKTDQNGYTVTMIPNNITAKQIKSEKRT